MPTLPDGEEIIACPTCRDAGFVSRDLWPGQEGFGKAIPCPSCSGWNDRGRILRRSRVPEGLIPDCSFDQVKAEWLPGGQRALHYAVEFAAGRGKPILVLMGNTGSGKTHLALAIVGGLVDAGYAVRFERTIDLFNTLRSTFDRNGEMELVEWLEVYQTVPALVLDDLEAAVLTPWAREQLYNIIGARYQQRHALRTVITTDRPLDGLDKRLVSRLSDQWLSHSIVFDGPDRRVLK